MDCRREDWDFLGLFKLQGLGRLVADLGGTEVLDRARINVAGVLSPFVAMSSEELEGSAVEFYKSLADNRLVSAVTTFDVHHHRDGYTAGDPL